MARPEDAPALAAIYGHYVETSVISFEVERPSVAEMGARLAACVAIAPWLVFEERGEVTGYAYASKHRERAAYRWSIDTSVYVRPEARGRGIGRALYTSLLALVRAQGFFVAHAGITLPNAASVRLHEAMGFTPVGVYAAVGFKDGAWHDVGWWRLALRAPAAPDEPMTLEALARWPGFEEALRAGLAAP
jgi:phosphinothricin acetyltransferase